MYEKLEKLNEEYQELGRWLSSSDAAKSIEFAAKSKRYAELTPLVGDFVKLKKIEEEIGKNEALLSGEADAEMAKLVEEELTGLANEREELTVKLERALTPKDPNDERDIIIEIRAGAGGEESALFSGELLRMYERFAESKGYKLSIMSASQSETGGFKEVIAEVSGQGAYSSYKYESGVHRVQRVPVTESSGRIHTSTATVAVLPQAEDVDIEIRPEDLKIDTYRSGGAGGQHVNTTDSAVRITHLPTGTVATCQDERSQLKNREKAMSILRARLYADKAEAERKARGLARNIQIGTGDRSEKIRTYNYPQDRVTDHRINLTLSNIAGILDGNLDPLVTELKAADEEMGLNATSTAP